jgi:phosphate acetyltransferase
MARSVYIAGLSPGAGKSLIALGVAELLSRRVASLGVFRPLVSRADDPLLAMLRERYRIEGPSAYGVTDEQAGRMLAEGRVEELVGEVVSRFRAVADEHTVTVVIGTDLDTADTQPAVDSREMAVRTRLATEMGSTVIAIVDGQWGELPHLLDAVWGGYHVLAAAGTDVLALIVNRVPGPLRQPLLEALTGLPVPVYTIPEVPGLAAPTVAEVADQLHAVRLLGAVGGESRDVLSYVVGAAQLPVLLDHLVDGCLLITPGDRADLIVAAAAAHAAGTVSIAGIVLTLGLRPDPRVLELVERIATGLPLLAVEEDSFATITHANRIEARPYANPRKVEVALGAFEDHVDLADLADRVIGARSTRVTPLMFEYDLIERARADRRHIVLPEGTEEWILRAAEILRRRGVADLTLLGPEAEVTRRGRELGLDLADVGIVDPATSPWREEFAKEYAKLRQHKGITLERAIDMIGDVNYFGTMMVHSGRADGMVSGAAHTTAATIRPAFEIVSTEPGVSVASSVFFMCLADRVLVYGDCAINPDPDAAQLADIAITSAVTAARFGIEPRVAMLSYSTGTSGTGLDVDKVAAATALVRERRPDLPVVGPIQYDAAVDPAVAAAKLPGSTVAGRATVLIFPDLNTGNNTYKAVQRSAGAVAVGPVVQGLNAPVNDLSRGATVTDIVNTVAITAIQAASGPSRKADGTG